MILTIKYIIITSVICSELTAGMTSLCNDVINKYTRPFTVLEIAPRDNLKSHEIAHQNQSAVCAALIPGKYNTAELIKDCSTQHTNMVLLHPEELTKGDLETLIKCEHFDVVIVHHPEKFNCEQYFHLFEQLGDHLIIKCKQATWNEQRSTLKGTILTEEFTASHCICLITHTRTALAKARWNSNKTLKGYTIISNFNEKKLEKSSTNTTSNWIPGINMMTAIALGVEYPTDSCIRGNLHSFEDVDHNDIVLGNMIVQGKKIALIDFGDPRRNADKKRLLSAALKLFSWLHRCKDPQEMLDKYSRYCKKKKQ